MADDSTLAWQFLEEFTNDSDGVQINMAIDAWYNTDVFQQFGGSVIDMAFLFKKVLQAVQHIEQSDAVADAVTGAISKAQELQESDAGSAEQSENLSSLKKKLAQVLIAAGWDIDWGSNPEEYVEEVEQGERLAKLPKITGLRTRTEFLEHNLKPKVSGLAEDM
jgi:hypothetical protein